MSGVESGVDRDALVEVLAGVIESSGSLPSSGSDQVDLTNARGLADAILAALPSLAPAGEHVVHVVAEPIAEDVVWCEDCEEWVTAGAAERAPAGETVTESRYALRWAAAGVWQWQEFDTREALTNHAERLRDYFYDPEWDRGTQVWRLDTDSNALPWTEATR